MSSITPDALRQEIEENSNKTGAPVKQNDGTPATASVPLYVDSNKDLAAGAFPFAIPFAAAAVTDSALSVSATPNGNIMTQTLVAGASATTFTSAGFVRMTVVSTNEAIMSSGSYYLQVGTLT